MDAVDALLLQAIDLRVLGDRLRAARLARGWTQTELADGLMSVGYVSRLESGQRRPNTATLESLASRLDIAIDELLRGPTAREQDAIRLSLDFAELSLETGDVIEAEAKAREARDRARLLRHTEMEGRAQYLVARALEQQGNLDDAILELEPLVASPVGSSIGLHAAIALCRCLRECGDLNLAIDMGERVLDELDGTPLDGVDEAVQLSVTVGAAYYVRGDIRQGVRICRKAIDKAERLASPKARASAYWNASMMEAREGSVRQAIPLAERALSLLSQGQDGRNLARLRVELADMQLRLDPPEITAALDGLDQADLELRQSSGSAIDLARNDGYRARALLLAGDFAGACEVSARVHAAAWQAAPVIAADAKAVEGQAAAAVGQRAEASQAYRQAVMLLTSMGADRGAAELWFELAGLLEAIGDLDAARMAYRSAAASTGLRSRTMLGVAIDQLAID